jgi:hypothetical protein
MSPSARSNESSWFRTPHLPASDTPGGTILAFAFGLAVIYLVVFVSDYSAMTSLALWIAPIALFAALVGAFALGTMLGADIATYQGLELDLSRTVLAYVGAGTPPASDAPLSGIWRAYVGAAEESRRMARAHAYALGFFVAAGLFALPGTLVVGLGAVAASQDLLGFGLFLLWFAFGFLVAGAGNVVLSVGYSNPVPGFDRIAARRWKRNAGRQQAVDGAYSEVAWLGEFVRGARESYVHPAGPSVIPSWREG